MNEIRKKIKCYIRDIQAMKRRCEKIVWAALREFNSTQMAEETGAVVLVIGGGTTAMMIGGRPHAVAPAMEEGLCLTRQFTPVEI